MSVILGETIVKFGTGDIEVVTIRRPDENYDYGIAFKQQDPPRPIGEANPDSIGKTVAEVGCFLRFEFTNPESVAVVIHQLEKVWAGLSGSSR